MVETPLSSRQTTEPDPSLPLAPEVRPEVGELARSAGINAAGNVASRALGLAREALIAGTFGATAATSAWDAVSGIPKMVYELLIGGMLSAALVPVLSEYASPDRKEELDYVLSLLLSLATVVLIGSVLLLELAAGPITAILLPGLDPEARHLGVQLTRIIVPAVLVYGISGIIQAYHYASNRFIYPSMGAPAHNLGMIIGVLLLANLAGIKSLSLGVLLAATTQLLVQLPGLKGTRLIPCLRFDHPVVSRILKLYAPVLLSVVVANVGILIDRRFASQTAAEAITWMAKATYLIQLPLGLVSMAISLAVLPTLSRIDARQDLHRFRVTLSQGLRLVLVLIIPAGVGLLALGRPIIELIYEHGAFGPTSTSHTLAALRIYLIGLPFAAIDLPLVFAFYAQKDTVTPVLVGIAAVGVYLAIGPLSAFLLGWGFLGLVLANSAQLASHAALMLLLFRKRYEGLAGYGVMTALLKAAAASACMGLVAWLAWLACERLFATGDIVAELLRIGLPTAIGTVAFALVARVLRISEYEHLLTLVRQRLLGARP
jgi:putative peptidoglycan lipid II flippase